MFLPSLVSVPSTFNCYLSYFYKKKTNRKHVVCAIGVTTIFVSPTLFQASRVSEFSGNHTKPVKDKDVFYTIGSMSIDLGPSRARSTGIDEHYLVLTGKFDFLYKINEFLD